MADVYTLQPITITEEDILLFATSFDPQPIHVDQAYAEEGPFGGIIASGFHTLSAVWGRWIEAGYFGQQTMGGTGMESLKWLAPVRPGDTLFATVTVVETKPSRSKAQGLVKLQFDVRNQHDAVVMVTDGSVLLRSRVGG
ncbi:MAG: MaoC/PaaZ C-terminal domain-containing protein [Sulfobacillus sp.]